jgi:hypothetical protein
MKKVLKPIPIEKFGKDHWSLFAYIETRCVDHKGILDKNHMRCKNEAAAAGRTYPGSYPSWDPKYGTRLKGYFKDGGENDESLKLPEHDDLDCFDDLEAAGLIENMGTGLHPAAKLTKYGHEIAGKLREHKANGGYFANFEYAK